MPVGKRLTQHHFEGARWRSSLWKCFMTAWELISYYNSFEWLLTLLKFYLPKKFGRIFVKYMVSFRFEWIMFPFLVEKNLFFQAITVVYFRTSWNSYCLNKNIQPINRHEIRDCFFQGILEFGPNISNIYFFKWRKIIIVGTFNRNSISIDWNF